MNAIELFAGMGLSSIGLVWSKCRLVRAYEIMPNLVSAFNGQEIGLLPPVARQADLSKRSSLVKEQEPIHLLAGGPVCKAFSPGATVFGTQGRDDERNTFPYFFDAIDFFNPTHVLMENSFGLARFQGYLNEIKDALTMRGYLHNSFEIDCFDFGVPQHRRRLVIMASKAGQPLCPKPFRVATDPSCVGECLQPAPMYDPWPITAPISPKGMAYLHRDPRHLKKHPPMNMEKPASTVVANYHRGVPYGLVDLYGTLELCGPRLAGRLQGLPERYRLDRLSKTEALKAIGNGFPPHVVAAAVRSFQELKSD